MTTTITAMRPRRGHYKRTHHPVASDISQAIQDLREEGWSWTRIAEWSGYTRRHVIRIHKQVNA